MHDLYTKIFPGTLFLANLSLARQIPRFHLVEVPDGVRFAESDPEMKNVPHYTGIIQEHALISDIWGRTSHMEMMRRYYLSDLYLIPRSYTVLVTNYDR